MAAIGLVQMLIEAAEYLDRRERGKVLHFALFAPVFMQSCCHNPSPTPVWIRAPSMFKGCQEPC
ncbi:unnamed protein product [Tetraodon nigroviridis]|uniref:(spotted green pufferfish) hypothetical protein n=1 Tax=Tetraodon nigroviridis TaxID=99883 RepID=Q4RPF8_TETNG|nr:unnamed protein product [Tetraodon nigroviridis]